MKDKISAEDLIKNNIILEIDIDEVVKRFEQYLESKELTYEEWEQQVNGIMLDKLGKYEREKI